MADVDSRWLNEEIDRLMAEARALQWSEEGQIIHVRMGMERAYERVRNMENE